MDDNERAESALDGYFMRGRVCEGCKETIPLGKELKVWEGGPLDGMRQRVFCGPCSAGCIYMMAGWLGDVGLTVRSFIEGTDFIEADCPYHEDGAEQAVVIWPLKHSFACRRCGRGELLHLQQFVRLTARSRVPTNAQPVGGA